MKAGKNYLERLVIKAAGRIYFLETSDIDWIEAEGNYVSVHSGKKNHLLRETISSLEAQLDPRNLRNPRFLDKVLCQPEYGPYAYEYALISIVAPVVYRTEDADV